MKYAVEMSSGAMILIPSSINIGSGIQKLIRGIYIYRQHGDLISLLSSFQNIESRLKKILEYCIMFTGQEDGEIVLLSKQEPQTQAMNIHEKNGT
jgi:hypothetical protein